MTNKLILDGRVAVIISPGFGAGFATWNRDYFEDLLFDKQLVLAIGSADKEAFDKRIEEIYPDAYYHFEELQVQWVPEGELFYVDEYDGFESIVHQSDMRRA